MLKRLCAAAAVGLFTSAVLGQVVGDPGTGSAGDRPLPSAGQMIGSGSQADRDRRTSDPGSTTTGGSRICA